MGSRVKGKWISRSLNILLCNAVLLCNCNQHNITNGTWKVDGFGESHAGPKDKKKSSFSWNCLRCCSASSTFDAVDGGIQLERTQTDGTKTPKRTPLKSGTFASVTGNTSIKPGITSPAETHASSTGSEGNEVEMINRRCDFMDRVEGQRDENNIISPTKSNTSDLEENNIPPSHSTLHAKNRLQTSTVVGGPPPDKVRKKEILPSGNTIYHMVDGSTLIHTPGGKIITVEHLSNGKKVIIVENPSEVDDNTGDTHQIGSGTIPVDEQNSISSVTQKNESEDGQNGNSMCVSLDSNNQGFEVTIDMDSIGVEENQRREKTILKEDPSRDNNSIKTQGEYSGNSPSLRNAGVKEKKLNQQVVESNCDNTSFKSYTSTTFSHTMKRSVSSGTSASIETLQSDLNKYDSRSTKSAPPLLERNKHKATTQSITSAKTKKKLTVDAHDQQSDDASMESIPSIVHQAKTNNEFPTPEKEQNLFIQMMNSLSLIGKEMQKKLSQVDHPDDCDSVESIPSIADQHQVRSEERRIVNRTPENLNNDRILSNNGMATNLIASAPQRITDYVEVNDNHSIASSITSAESSVYARKTDTTYFSLALTQQRNGDENTYNNISDQGSNDTQEESSNSDSSVSSTSTSSSVRRKIKNLEEELAILTAELENDGQEVDTQHNSVWEQHCDFFDVDHSSEVSSSVDSDDTEAS